MTILVHGIAIVLAALTVIATALPLLFPRAKSWKIRVFDFPRMQVACVGAVAVVLAVVVPGGLRWPWALVPLVTLVVVVYQVARIWRYLPLAPREVEQSRRSDSSSTISLLLCNVEQENQESERVVRTVREADPDIIVCVETNAWWIEHLDVLRSTHPHGVRRPQPNTYGMAVYSRLPLDGLRTEFLVEGDVPSIQGMLRLDSGQRIWLNCLHPRPPVPGEQDSSAERDAELVLVGRRVKDADVPVIVCGDLNDVAWSRTTRLFQKISGLVDPRKGRGLYSTFHARHPFLRFPLDHFFFSPDFRLVELRLLEYVGSDHFPVCLRLSLEPDAVMHQDAPQGGGEEKKEGDEDISRARERQAPREAVILHTLHP